MDILNGFFNTLFSIFQTIINAIAAVATFNPVGALDSIDMSGVSAPLGFVRRFLPLSAFGSVILGFLPVFVVAVLILILWRWIKASGDE